MRIRIGLLGLVLVSLVALGVMTASADDEVTVTAGGTVNVRSGPGTQYVVITQLYSGETVAVTARDSTSNTWFEVDADGDIGWVSASVVSLNGDPTTLDVVEDDGGETTVGNTGVTATIGEDPVNVRSGPGESYSVIGQAGAGNSYDVEGYNGVDDPLYCRGNAIVDLSGGENTAQAWLLINYNGSDAWVNYTVVSVSGDLCDLDSLTDEDVVADAEDAAAEDEDLVGDVYVVTLDDINLRETSYAKSEVLLVIPYGRTVRVEAVDNTGTRIRVVYQDTVGWISTTFIEVTRGSLDSLPVEPD